MADAVKPLTWKEVASCFDQTGSLSIHHRNGKGNAYRLRIPGYDRRRLVQLRRIFGRGNISAERKPNGRNYYRLEIGGLAGTVETLEQLLPFLDKKKTLAEKWIEAHKPFIGFDSW